MEDFKKVEKNVTSYKKYEKGGKDNSALAAKAPKMGDLVGAIPGKLHISSPASNGKPSVKKDSPNANKEHGGDGKSIS